MYVIGHKYAALGQSPGQAYIQVRHNNGVQIKSVLIMPTTTTNVTIIILILLQTSVSDTIRTKTPSMSDFRCSISDSTALFYERLRFCRMQVRRTEQKSHRT